MLHANASLQVCHFTHVLACASLQLVYTWHFADEQAHETLPADLWEFHCTSVLLMELMDLGIGYHMVSPGRDSCPRFLHECQFSRKYKLAQACNSGLHGPFAEKQAHGTLPEITCKDFDAMLCF